MSGEMRLLGLVWSNVTTRSYAWFVHMGFDDSLLVVDLELRGGENARRTCYSI